MDAVPSPASRFASAMPFEMTVRMLLKSCATPPARTPRLSSFCAWTTRSVEGALLGLVALAVGDVANDRDSHRSPLVDERRARVPRR